MHHTSLFPPLPHVPEQNVHHILLNRPDQQSWRDFTFHVDVLTGEQRSFREFVERVRDGATALGTEVEHGGLGIHPENNEVIGILSENCLVRDSRLDILSRLTIFLGLCGTNTFSARNNRALCHILVLCDPIRISIFHTTFRGNTALC